jgi:hypothetical protein
MKLVMIQPKEIIKLVMVKPIGIICPIGVNNNMKRTLAFILILACPTVGMAQVAYVTKDQPSPYTGYLFTLDAELQNRMKLEQLKTVLIEKSNDEQLLALKDAYIKDDTTEIAMWKVEAQDLSKQVVEQQSSTFWHSILYFGLGVISATAMAFAVSHATR